MPVVFGVGLVLLLLLVADGLGRGGGRWPRLLDGHLAGDGLLLALLHPGDAPGLLHVRGDRLRLAILSARGRIGWAVAAGASWA